MKAEIQKLTSLSLEVRRARNDAEENGESEELIQATQRDCDAIRQTKDVLMKFQSVDEYVAKAAGADNVDMDIGKISADESNNISAGLTNVERVLNLKYKQGDITAGKNNTIKVGWHNER